MIYTVHVGARENPWPAQVGEASTRAAAQEAARRLLAAAPADITKAEVRCQVRLLDTYGKRPHSVRHVYAAKQRQVGNRDEVVLTQTLIPEEAP